MAGGIPLRFVPKENLSKEDKLTMTFDGFILGNMQALFPSHGKIVHGKNFKVTRTEIEEQFPKVKSIISEIRKFSSPKEPPPKVILNKHCQVCEFKESCRATAVEKDGLSLLVGISAKEIVGQNKKGIFTVTQYSYTFRSRRKFRRDFKRAQNIELEQIFCGETISCSDTEKTSKSQRRAEG